MLPYRFWLPWLIVSFSVVAFAVQQVPKTHSQSPATPTSQRVLAEADLVPAGPCNTIAKFLQLNGGIPKSVDEWELALSRYGAVVRSNVGFSLNPTPTSLEEPRVVFMVDPTDVGSDLNVPAAFAIAGIRRKDGTLDNVEFIAPPLGDETRMPEFGAIRNGMAKVVRPESEFCFSCHKNRAFIFPEQPWSNTTFDATMRKATYDVLKQAHPNEAAPFVEKLRKTDPSHLDSVLQTVSIRGLNLKDNAFSVDQALIGVNARLNVQRWLADIPDRSVRTDLAKILTLAEMSQKLSMSVDAGRNTSLPTDADYFQKELIEKFEPAKAHAKKYALASQHRVNARSSEEDIISFDKLNKRDRSAALTILNLHPLSSPEAFNGAADFVDPGGQGGADIAAFPFSITDQNRIANWLEKTLDLLPEEKKTSASRGLFGEILKDPILTKSLSRGFFPSKKQFYDAFAKRAPEYFRREYKILPPAFPVFAFQAFGPCEPPSKGTEKKAAVAPTNTKCVGCHRGDSIAPRLLFPVDPTDKVQREEWFKQNDPEVTKALIAKFWKRAIVKRNMPPDRLSESDYQDLKSFLASKAALLRLELPAAQ